MIKIFCIRISKSLKDSDDFLESLCSANANENGIFEYNSYIYRIYMLCVTISVQNYTIHIGTQNICNQEILKFISKCLYQEILIMVK